MKETDQTSPGTKPLTFQDFVPAELITSPKYSPDGPLPPKRSLSFRISQKREKEKRRGHSRHMSTSSASSSSSSAKRHVEFTEEPTSDISPKERFREAVKASGMPKMQGVVQSLRRSVTSVTKKGFGGRKGRERPQSEIKDSKAAAEYVQLTDS